MRQLRVVAGLEELVAARHDVGHCLLLYSGGLDGSYFIEWAKRHGIAMTALHLRLVDPVDDAQEAVGRAGRLGVRCLVRDIRDEFIEDHVGAAIQANAWYQGLYPVASSLSRPLMAKVAVDVAHDIGASAVVHTATYMQNTAARFTLALAALDPGLTVVAPFLRSTVSRSHKLARLQSVGLSFPRGVYSIDENLWARVIECGSLEDPELPLPDSGIFSWTRDINHTPVAPETVDIDLEAGLPVALNGQRMSLASVVAALNTAGGRHGVGRFSGLEQVTFGVKNHEVREAPAAHILTSVHREVEAAVLTESELSLKRTLDNQWTNLIVGGHWYSHLAGCLRQFSSAMNSVVTGRVQVRLHRGNVTVLAKQAPAGLYYSRFQDDFAEVMQQYAFAEAYHVMALPVLARAGSPIDRAANGGGDGVAGTPIVA